PDGSGISAAPRCAASLPVGRRCTYPNTRTAGSKRSAKIITIYS
ncbi:hypothetical protein HMPREF0908_1142, partial [Selenomonas flueggei ATCC 43531]